MFNYTELDVAIKKAGQKHAIICPDMAKLLISTIIQTRTDNLAAGHCESLPLTMRNTLNKFHVVRNRDAYKTLIGIFFAQRAQYAKKHGLVKQALPNNPRIETEIQPDGQVAIIF